MSTLFPRPRTQAYLLIKNKKLKAFICIGLVSLQIGCASIFGWDIHAPGILSESFSQTVQPVHERVALYLPPGLLEYKSYDRGSRTADPQTYHVGEALGPMLVEAFQDGFDEFVFMETEPTPEILKQYGISYLVLVKIKDFKNRVTWGSHAVSLVTETIVLDSNLELLGRFEATGTSDAKKVFAKKGGPQVNLNAAIENNAMAIIQYFQDSIQKGLWEGTKKA